MAEKPDENSASFKLVIHPDPTKDELTLYVHYRNVWVRLQWKDSEQKDVIDLLASENAMWFLERGRIELEVNRQRQQIDADLDTLLSEADEEVEGDE